MTPRRGRPVLSLRDVGVRYRGGDGAMVDALADVTLDLVAGEMIGIFGPSGCGKTTLLMAAGLLETITSGSVRFAGTAAATIVDDAALRDFRRRHIGFVFQKPNLVPFLTAVENVALAMVIDGVPRAAAERRAMGLLAVLDMAHRAGNHPARLSGGEQQRVAVARALANDPILLLADEPTAALDSRRGRQVMELLLAIARQRLAAIAVVTHDPRSMDLFDRVVEMEDGRVVAGNASSAR
ncbi:ABC transporter ATP-binding protein [Neoroseomonas lacus]|uniref:ABC transporter ATP-binding protein n=1 Tax=Neoroseomonas lacus TaxID=287609 RepID=A0A917L0D4_9PROT|nr:ABC transporter ATP-binding protein [Neoroseomonas lacus]GGJ35465.1 ABC transporter ATP-binding protein [Neoroseomonas lacus]